MASLATCMKRGRKSLIIYQVGARSLNDTKTTTDIYIYIYIYIYAISSS
jgi:hypothetical protein